MFTLCHSVAATPKCLNDNLFFRKHFGVSRRDISERAGVIGPSFIAASRRSRWRAFRDVCPGLCVKRGSGKKEQREIVEIDFVYKNEDMRRVAVVRTALALFFTPLLEPVRYL